VFEDYFLKPMSFSQQPPEEYAIVVELDIRIVGDLTETVSLNPLVTNLIKGDIVKDSKWCAVSILGQSGLKDSSAHHFWHGDKSGPKPFDVVYMKKDKLEKVC
jgi:hypothetical protein